jgi:hypothetical protein
MGEWEPASTSSQLDLMTPLEEAALLHDVQRMEGSRLRTTLLTKLQYGRSIALRSELYYVVPAHSVPDT